MLRTAARVRANWWASSGRRKDSERRISDGDRAARTSASAAPRGSPSSGIRHRWTSPGASSGRAGPGSQPSTKSIATEGDDSGGVARAVTPALPRPHARGQLAQDRGHLGAGVAQEEMAAVDRPELERAARVASPSAQLGRLDAGVGPTRDRRHGHGQRLARHEAVGLPCFQVGTHGREQQRPDAGIVDQFRGRSVHRAQIVEHVRVGCRVELWPVKRNVRRTAGTDDQVLGRTTEPRAQPARNLERDQGAEAVAVQDRGPAQLVAQIQHQCVGDLVDRGEWALARARAVPGQLDGEHAYVRRESGREPAEDRGVAPEVRQAHQRRRRPGGLRRARTRQEPGVARGAHACGRLFDPVERDRRVAISSADGAPSLPRARSPGTRSGACARCRAVARALEAGRGFDARQQVLRQLADRRALDQAHDRAV